MLLVLTSLWLPCDAWSGSPERIFSPSSFPVHSHTTGSWTYQAMKSHSEGMRVGWGGRERESKTTRGKKPVPGDPTEMPSLF